MAAKLLAADFQRKTRLDPFENKRSKAKMWNAAEVSKNVLSTLNSAKVTPSYIAVADDLLLWWNLSHLDWTIKMVC